jgi:hypothetical protein
MVQLNVSVTLEKDNDPSMDDELVKTLMDQIQKEMDEDIMRKLYIGNGWIPVKFHFKDNFQAVDINNWLAETCQSKYHRLGSDYLFEDKKDAEWFLLRWL